MPHFTDAISFCHSELQTKHDIDYLDLFFSICAKFFNQSKPVKKPQIEKQFKGSQQSRGICGLLPEASTHRHKKQHKQRQINTTILIIYFLHTYLNKASLRRAFFTTPRQLQYGAKRKLFLPKLSRIHA